jgi:hypothetical protein
MPHPVEMVKVADVSEELPASFFRFYSMKVEVFTIVHIHR